MHSIAVDHESIQVHSIAVDHESIAVQPWFMLHQVHATPVLPVPVLPVCSTASYIMFLPRLIHHALVVLLPRS